jgi:hypothetical protein
MQELYWFFVSTTSTDPRTKTGQPRVRPLRPYALRGGTAGHVSTFTEPGLIQVPASCDLAYLEVQHRQSAHWGLDAAVVATRISRSGSTGQDQLMLSVHVTKCKGFRRASSCSDEASQ